MTWLVTQSVSTWTNSGEFNGRPATEKAMRVQGISMVRFVDGKIVEEWAKGDMLEMMTPIGHLPA